MTRKRRGMRTQMLLAKRWRESGMCPYATDVGAGRPGRDVLHTPGLFVEVKARAEASLPGLLRKAQKDKGENELPVVVWRHNKQGELGIADWTVTMRLADFEHVWRKANGVGVSSASQT